ncbi:MAG: molybdopterin-dependent oxidoreductase, partial [bacterium]
EFLLVNHPLDCPVCDKGGECPLQDIAMGWGAGHSRFTEPKRHFRKPIPLSPLVRIDRERCILCYRCVRFSQEVAEDEQLQLLERGSATYVGTFDDRPYIAPFHGNIIELCPVGALTSEAYRFRARPWEIEQAGSICTLCPSQCNLRFTVRDEAVQRVLARDNAEVDDGWLCDKGRFGFQMIAAPERITAPMIRAGGTLTEVSWEQALEAAAKGLAAAGGRAAAIVGGASSNEEGYLTQRITRAALGSANIDSRTAGTTDRGLLLDLSRPELSARLADIDAAESILVVGTDPLHQMPILDLRIRKAMRRSRARVAVATERPTALDGGAEETARYAPGDAAAFLRALQADLASDAGAAAGPYAGAASEIAGALRPGSTVIVWGERLGNGPDGTGALDALVACAAALNLRRDGSGLIEVPDGSNARGLREVGCLPTAGPGLAETTAGNDSAAIRDGLAAGDLDAALLINANPVRDFPGGPAWAEGLTQADFVVSVSMFDDESTRHADVVLPAESYAEKEGTVTHPDGRLQRMRPSIPHPGQVRPGWQVLAELSARLGDETGIDSATEALAALAAEVPFYAGITPDEIGGTGIRWQDREAASRLGEAPGSRAGDAGDADRARAANETVSSPERDPGASPTANGDLKLGTYRDLWAAEVTDRSPALRFLAPKQTVELAPADAERMGFSQGDDVDVRSNGTSVRARVAIRERMRPGAAFLIEGTSSDNANALAGAEAIEVVRVAPDPAAPGREAEEVGG